MDANAQSGYFYDKVFYEYQLIGAARSARAALAPIVDALGGIASILDVGCGAGAWLVEYERLGVRDVLGVDGAYVEAGSLLCPAEWVAPRDITKPFDFGRNFELVQCLEVAEHVTKESSEILVENLTRHGARILFSAAVPGQGGENHVNEQDYEFWRELFKLKGYRLFDFVRPLISGAATIEPWYRYNILFFVRDDAIHELPDAVRAHRVPDFADIRDYSPISYQLRKAILKRIPNTLTTMLARLKHRLIARSF